MFYDLINHWAERDVRWLAENGIIQPVNKYRPNDPLTRAEAAALIARTIEYILGQTKDT